MAKGSVKPPVEWVTFRYRDVYLIVGIIASLIVLGVGAVIWYQYAGNPRSKAEMKIKKAKDKYAEVEQAGVGTKSNLRMASENIEKAESAFEKQNYGTAASLAAEAFEILKNIKGNEENYATIAELEGTVEIKKANAHIFKTAKKGEFVGEGDIVKTGPGSSGKIKYPNGEYHDLYPDSYIIVENLKKKVGGGTFVKTKLEQGTVEKQTPADMNPNDESVIETANAKFKSGPASRLSVERNEGKGTKAKALSGEVEAQIGSETRKLNAASSGIAVSISEMGSVNISELISPPNPIQPRSDQIIQLEDPASATLTFEWENPSKTPTRFQLSSKPIFQKSSIIIEKAQVSENNIKMKGLIPSTYYWRIRTEGDEDKCYWSTSQKFKIIQKLKTPKIERNLKLDVSYTPLGDGVIIRGKTNPGIHVSVNDIEISINSDGSFNKIVLFSELGNQVVVVRAFDDQGNEKIWQKSFASSQM